MNWDLIDRRKVRKRIREVEAAQKEITGNLRSLGTYKGKYVGVYTGNNAPGYPSYNLPFDEWRDANEQVKYFNHAFEEHFELGLEMTRLCCLLAQARGKLHMEKFTKKYHYYDQECTEVFTEEDQINLIGDLYKDFLIEEKEAA